MSRHRPLEVWAWALLAVLTPAITLTTLAWQDHTLPAPTAPADLPQAEALASRTEERALPPSEWLRLAQRAPSSIARAAAWCRRHEDAPLPNCANLLTAHRVCTLLDSLTGGDHG